MTQDLYICPDCEQLRAIAPDSVYPDCAEWRALKLVEWDQSYRERLRRVDRLRQMRMKPNERIIEEIADMAKAVERIRR
jgi:HAMP domain-containing protein